MLLRTCSSVLFTLLSLVALSANARSQALDDVWFKVTMKVNGGAITPSGDLEKAKGSVVAYMHVSLDESPAENTGGAEGFSATSYLFDVISETAPGVFQQSSTGSFLTTGPDELAMVGSLIGPNSCGIPIQVVVPDEDATILNLLFVARLKLKFDKQDMLKSASFKSSGAMMPYGSGDGDVLVGGVKLKGKMIPEEKLPFDV